jgi:hypothetical protein
MDGHADRARRILEKAAPHSVEGAVGPDLAVAARIAAAIALEENNATRAATLLGASRSLLGSDDGRGYDAPLHTSERTREALSERAFAKAYESGAALERDAAIDLLAEA